MNLEKDCKAMFIYIVKQISPFNLTDFQIFREEITSKI